MSTGAPVQYLDSELYLASSHHARFSWQGRDYDDGQLCLTGELCQQLLELELDAEAYGSRLFEALFPSTSPLRAGLRAALAAAEGDERRLRLRLHMATGLANEVRGLCWELLYDPEHKVALARSPDTAFSRYCTVPLAPGSPAPAKPRLLALVAAPSNASRYQMAAIDHEQCERQLRELFAEVDDRLELDLLAPPATPGRLRERLSHGGYHALHIHGHGFARRGRQSSLILEEDDGTARFVEETVLAEIFLGNRDLRLVTLVACHGGALSSNDAFSGLAARLVQRGVPAVIGMCRALAFDTAQVFSAHLYRTLARTGRVDVAVNEARQQVFLSDPRDVAWSSPLLYMRLPDGLLWAAEPADPGALPSAPSGAVPVTLQQRSWAWLRQAALALVTLTLTLAVWPAPSAEADLELVVSRIGFQLASTQPVIEHLKLAELAASSLRSLRLPPAAGLAPSLVRQDQLKRPLGLRLTADPASPPASALSLQLSFVPAGRVIALEQLEALQYRLSIDLPRDTDGRPLAAGDAGRDVDVSVAITGKARLKMLHAEALDLEAQHPETLEIQPLRSDLQLDLTLAPSAANRFAQPLGITDLGLLAIRETPDPTQTFFEQLSTIRSGTITLTSSGLTHTFKAGEQLRFSRVAASINRIEPGENGIAIAARGVFYGLESQVPGGRKLRPSVLGLWVGSGPGRVLLVLAVLLLLGLLLSLTPLPARLLRMRGGPSRVNHP